MTTLDPDFALYTQKRQLADFDAGIDAEVQAAFAGSADALAAALPARIDRGLVTPEEARDLAATIAAITADMQADERRKRELRSYLAGATVAMPEPFTTFRLGAGEDRPWQDKVAALRQLLVGKRSRVERAQIGTLPADAAVERRELEALEALHALYWSAGFGWTSPTGATPGSADWTAELQAELDSRAPPADAQEAA